jgi:hypothetical protein
MWIRRSTNSTEHTSLRGSAGYPRALAPSGRRAGRPRSLVAPVGRVPLPPQYGDQRSSAEAISAPMEITIDTDISARTV